MAPPIGQLVTTGDQNIGFKEFADDIAVFAKKNFGYIPQM
jgi:hypothetical protein